MELQRRRHLVPGILAGAWLLIVGWQVEEHLHVVEAARADLRNRSHEIASTLSAVIRASRFRGAVFQERLEPVLNELVHSRTNALVKTGGLPISQAIMPLPYKEPGMGLMPSPPSFRPVKIR